MGNVAVSVSLPDAFLKCVKSDPDSGCMIWARGKHGSGYGVFYPDGAGSGMLAHRYSFEVVRGAIPSGHQIDHLCRNKDCVNPWHLDAVTPRINTLRGLAGHHMKEKRDARTHCRYGHLLVDPYEYQGRRICRECKRKANREYMRRKHGYKSRSA